mmetsp:Transcript_23404/g.44031  ORF Transcript_23404/g.44031 Transcript_23404/m.44031 type:complete len:522 (-) Transcript_23404:80-1645(-)
MVNTKSPAKASPPPPPTPSKDDAPPKPPLPSIDAAAFRLCSLLGLPSVDSKGPPIKALPSGAGRTVRRWLSSSAVNKCRKLSYGNLVDGARRVLPDNSEITAVIESSKPMETGSEAPLEDSSSCSALPPHPLVLPAISSWLLSLAINSLLFDSSDASAAFALSGSALAAVGKAASQSNSTFTPPILSPLIARLYRFRSLAASAASPQAQSTVRNELVHAHRLACLSRAVDVQATLLNLMLRDLLEGNLIDQAKKLSQNATFPENASNNQLVRYLYYMGKIQALQLEYTDSFSKLSQSLRKAPENTGLAFRVAVQKLLIIVQLLMGEIPSRDIFFTEGMRALLLPYMELTAAVRQGDLTTFNKIASKHQPTFVADGTDTLINRLAHNVVKAGLRRLNISYSRIYLKDIAERLSLGSAKSAEYIVAKAIRDGVIDGVINHKEGYLQSNELVDVYSTTEPAEALHRRITFCLNTHADAVKGLRYPDDAYAKANQKKKKGDEEEKTEEEIAAEIEAELEEEEDEF